MAKHAIQQDVATSLELSPIRTKVGRLLGMIAGDARFIMIFCGWLFQGFPGVAVIQTE